MADNDREKIQYELLEALYGARKQVEYLEAAVAHNAAFLGTGVERQDQIGRQAPSSTALPDALVRYLDLVEPEDDISNYIGREGHDESRPRLGPDAPYELRPDTMPQIDTHLVGQLAFDHPSDGITFDAVSPVAPNIPSVSEEPVQPDFSNSPPAGTSTHAPREDSIKPEFTQKIEDGDSKPADHVTPVCKVGTSDECQRSCLALHAINDGVWDWNLQTGEVFCSSRWESIVGQPCSNPEPLPPLERLSRSFNPKDAQNLLSRFTDLIHGKLGRVRMIVRYPRSDSWGWGVLRAVASSDGERIVRVTAVLSDITAQREAEMALRASDEEYRAMAEDSPDLIARIDREGRFLYVSPNVIRYFSVTPDELVGKYIKNFDLSGELAFFEKTVTRIFDTGQPAQAELLLISPLVGEFLADCRFWPEFGVDGEVVSASVLVRDISYSRRLAENYYALFNNMEDGFILFEHVSGWEGGAPMYGADEFALVVMNPAFGRMFSLKQPEISGLRVNDLMGSDAEQWAQCLKRVLVEDRSVLQALRSANGGQFEISAYSPEQGRVACIVKNVTELLKIEQEIRLNESRLAALHRLSHMDAASEEDVIRYSLDQAVKLTGSSFGYLYLAVRNDGENGHIFWSHDMIGQKGELPEEGQLMPWCESGQCRAITRAEVVNAAQGGFAGVFGESMPVDRYMIAPVMEDGYIVCMAGVANKKEAYSPSDLRQLDLFINGMWFHLRRRWAVEDLRKAKEQAEAASRAKNEFLANVSHELRTPLNGILGMLQLLQQSELTEEQVECVTTANYSGRSLLRIISDILDFSRIEAGRMEIEPRLFDLAATIRSTLGMFMYQAERKNIEFILRMDDAIPSLLYGDDARVRQIIFNLVGNAFKFTRQGRITVECSLLPYCPQGKRCVYMAISDTGIGIPDEKVKDIFKAFTQLDASSTRRFPGTGLGLSIVQRLVELMGGTLTVESGDNGTTIHCSLIFEDPKIIPEDSEVKNEIPHAVPIDLLVVEDDPVSQFTLRALLSKGGYTCVCVADGRQALEALLARPFECIITDIQMPVMDGTEMARRIREGDFNDIEPGRKVLSLLGIKEESGKIRHAVPRDLPIIALTAYAMLGDKERLLGMGMDYYLTKPVIASELYTLLAHVGRIIESKRE